MKFSQFSSYLEKLEATSSRLEMTAILASLLKEASSEDITPICYLTLGQLGPNFDRIDFAIAERMMARVLAAAYGVSESKVESLYKREGDMGLVAQKCHSGTRSTATSDRTSKFGILSPAYGGLQDDMSVREVYETLLEIAKASGTGSQEKKVRLFAELLGKLEARSAKYVVRIALGTMRLGFSDKTLIDALSWMAKGDKSLSEEIEYHYNVHPDIGEVARVFKKKGIRGLDELGIEVGVPVMPALTQRIPTPKEMIEKMGEVFVEPKYDGTRVQLHFSKIRSDERDQEDLGLFGKRKYFVKTFTRNLEDTSHMFPDLLAAAERQIDAKEAVLDGEAVGVDSKTGRFLPFQETIQRKRKYGVAGKVKEIPLKLFLFDVLYLDGETLIKKPFEERRRILEKIVRNGEVIDLAPQEKTCDPKELKEIFEKARKEGLEGVVVKKVTGEYEVGARGFSWVKYKHEEEKGSLSDTIDAVVLGYYKGRGKRTGFGIGAFLVGVYDEPNDRFLTIAKVGTGLSDEQWVEMRKRCNEARSKDPLVRAQVAKELLPDVWVKPKIVVEIAADEITRSPLHTAGASEDGRGLALRFPRLISFRDDKSPEEATTVSEVEKMV